MRGLKRRKGHGRIPANNPKKRGAVLTELQTGSGWRNRRVCIGCLIICIAGKRMIYVGSIRNITYIARHINFDGHPARGRIIFGGLERNFPTVASCRTSGWRAAFRDSSWRHLRGLGSDRGGRLAPSSAGLDPNAPIICANAIQHCGLPRPRRSRRGALGWPAGRGSHSNPGRISHLGERAHDRGISFPGRFWN